MAYTIEIGLASDGLPVIKCSPEFYEKLFEELDAMIKVQIEMGLFPTFARKYTAISALTAYMKQSEAMRISALDKTDLSS